MSITPERKKLLGNLAEAGRRNSRLSILFREAVADKMGINATDAECLDFLLEAGSATAGQLAKAAGLTSGAMTAALDRLEEAGYVRRYSDPYDRRKVIVRPVVRRLKSGSKIYEAMARAALKATDDLTDAQLLTIIRHYDTMSAIYREHMERMNGRRG